MFTHKHAAIKSNVKNGEVGRERGEESLKNCYREQREVDNNLITVRVTSSEDREVQRIGKCEDMTGIGLLSVFGSKNKIDLSGQNKLKFYQFCQKSRDFLVILNFSPQNKLLSHSHY